MWHWVGALGLAVALALPAGAEDGAGLYARHCAACHQPDGQGVPGRYPPLADHLGRFVHSPEGRAYLPQVVRYGLAGPIRIDGIAYQAPMPPQADLDPAAIAAVLNHLLLTHNHALLPRTFAPYQAEEVTALIAEPLDRSRLFARRQELGDGDAIAMPMPVFAGARENYARACQGCHLPDGRGVAARVPPLKDFAGYFLHLPEGRAYLARVPLAAMAPLDDAELAEVLNWILVSFSREQLPDDFAPYEAAEVAGYRRDRIRDTSTARAALIEGLKSAGVLQ
jgi:mono/diheme cytochrome c family protein